MGKIQFPEGFIWGCATSPYQIEGGVHKNGRGETIWDRYCSIPGNVVNEENGNVASDRFHRYREDVTLMGRMGMKAYRFSIIWSRILPVGYDEVSEKGVQFYSNLIDELLAAGIKPYVTLYHWDLPQALQGRGGWTNPQMAEHSPEFGRICIDRFGDRAKKWITLNEPYCAAFLNCYEGRQAPGYHNFSVAVSAAYHMYVGHGLVVKYFRESGKSGEIGIALNLMGRLPFSEKPEGMEVTRQADGYLNRWFIEPIMLGKYPRGMTDPYTSQGVILPKFQKEKLELMSQPLDFIGLNYYNDFHVKYSEKVWPLQFVIEGLPHSMVSDRSWPVTEMSFKRIVKWMRGEYGVSNIVVTENGTSFHDVMSGGYEVEDYVRLDYLERHIRVLCETIEKGIDVSVYFVWSFYDNLKWSFGYNSRFEIVYVDFKTQKRTVKESGHWYSQMIEYSGLEI